MFRKGASPWTTKTDAKGRKRVAADQGYEVAQFALHHAISLEQPAISSQHSETIEALYREAAKLKT
jgi:hypothetical protein